MPDVATLALGPLVLPTLLPTSSGHPRKQGLELKSIINNSPHGDNSRTATAPDDLIYVAHVPDGIDAADYIHTVLANAREYWMHVCPVDLVLQCSRCSIGLQKGERNGGTKQCPRVLSSRLHMTTMRAQLAEDIKAILSVMVTCAMR